VTDDRRELDPLAAGAQRLAGKVCVVTGSGQGIGRAVARRLAAEGARIVVAEWVAETAHAALEELHAHGVDAVVAVEDVSTSAGAKRLMQSALDAFDRIDVLVNSVGGTIWWKRYGDYTEEEIQRELDRSLFPTLWCCHAVLPIMVQQYTGSIVNLSSGIVEGGLFRTPYAISKGGVEAMTRTLASEYGSYGIRVNAVSPGSTAIRDRFTSRLTLRPGMVAEASPDLDARVAEARGDLTKLALGRQGTPEEQAAAVAFFACDDSSYVTGQILRVSGDP
jgi:dihydroxycyclohexadiene carboxylate dehydrogenase